MSEALEYGLALGTNLGDRRSNLQQALDFLDSGPFRLMKVSAFYETAPWGFDSENGFMNACVLLQTQLRPQQVLKSVKDYEKSKGREKRTGDVYTDRVIDLDILFCGNEVVQEEGLTLPHAHLHERTFVLRPLTEICPGWTHPILRKTVKEMLENLETLNLKP